jgi:hypothetical protein
MNNDDIDEMDNFDTAPAPAPAEEDSAPTAGDRLVGGALTRQHGLARPLARAEPRPAMVPATTTGIELRPGLVIDDAKFALLWRMSKAFSASGLYRRFDTVEAVFTVIMRGQELGLGPQTALDSFHLIQGKPTMGAHLIIALAKGDADCIYFECVEHDETKATYVARKHSMPNHELSFTYTFDDARNDGNDWVNKPKNRKAMLRKVAGSQAARLWFPASALGLYSMEEFGVDTSDVAA